MRKVLLPFVCLLCFLAPLRAQDYIRRSYYGAASSRESALSSLLDQVREAVPFSTPRLADTYRADLAKAAVERQQNGKTVFQLDGAALDKVFLARQKRAGDILEEGKRAREAAVKMTYYRWAWYYLSSLPPAYQGGEKENIQAWILAHPGTQAARLQVPMTHIEREVASIQGIIGPIPGPAPVREAPARTLVQAEKKAGPEAPVPARTALRIGPVQTLSALVAGPERSFGLQGKPAAGPLPLPQVERPWVTRVFLTSGFAPEPLFGATVSVRKRWGVLAGFQSNFKKGASAYSALSDGRVPAGGYIWPNGQYSISQLALSAGASYAVFPWGDVWLQAGYGQRNVYWQDSEDQWARMEDLSAQGLLLGAGALVSVKRISVLAGLTTIAFKTLGVTLGLGVAF